MQSMHHREYKLLLGDRPLDQPQQSPYLIQPTGNTVAQNGPIREYKRLLGDRPSSDATELQQTVPYRVNFDPNTVADSNTSDQVDLTGQHTLDTVDQATLDVTENHVRQETPQHTVR